MAARSNEAGIGTPAAMRIAAEALERPVSAVVQRVIDGDTIEVHAATRLGQSLPGRVRIDNTDAPEMEARCVEERREALAAREFLVRRRDGAAVRLTSVVYNKYGGRVRANVADAQGDIASALRASGLLRPYHGERRAPWCAAT